MQVDTDGDRLVSLSEFMAATQRDEFLEKDEWHVRLEVQRPPSEDDVYYPYDQYHQFDQ